MKKVNNMTSAEIRQLINTIGRNRVTFYINETYTLFLRNSTEDPHQKFADFMGITRQEAKCVYYYMCYTREEPLGVPMRETVGNRYLLREYRRELLKLGVPQHRLHALEDIADYNFNNDYFGELYDNDRQEDEIISIQG